MTAAMRPSSSALSRRMFEAPARSTTEFPSTSAIAVMIAAGAYEVLVEGAARGSIRPASRGRLYWSAGLK